ncbi:MAG: branched-chain amino acid aminotransferase [Bacteroidia bacterium]|nr:branched-chain amino acid aminotransferase [Bacteroidia bacterium]MDW8134083.1 branched-chain amino acid aminotransferase [Bacteroidia bacterium]
MPWSITIQQAPPRPEAIIWEELPFGRIFSQHMAVAEYKDGKWQEARVQPFEPLSLSPGTSALHYGQALFEGFKAYQRPDGFRFVFRPKDHWQRLNHSAHRLSMPEVPYELFISLLHHLLLQEVALFPPNLQHAIYIRPVYFATDPWLGVRPSETYMLVIYLTPVGPYYKDTIKAYVETELSRAASGGTGTAKMAGNYAAALLSGRKAQAKGCQVSLWLDAFQHEYVEEFSTMNVFFVQRDSTLITPSLERGTILQGITRDTILYLAYERGLSVEERDISIHEVIENITHGRITEIFGTGTAATIMPIQSLFYEDKVWELPPHTPIAQMLLTDYKAILQGDLKGNPEWIWPV